MGRQVAEQEHMQRIFQVVVERGETVHVGVEPNASQAGIQTQVGTVGSGPVPTPAWHVECPGNGNKFMSQRRE